MSRGTPLTDKQRTHVRKLYNDGLVYREIVDITGISLTCVGNIIRGGNTAPTKSGLSHHKVVVVEAARVRHFEHLNAAGMLRACNRWLEHNP